MLFPEVRCNLCSIEAVARLWLFHCRPSCPVAWPATRVAGDRLKLYRQGAAVAAAARALQPYVALLLAGVADHARVVAVADIARVQKRGPAPAAGAVQSAVVGDVAIAVLAHVDNVGAVRHPAAVRAAGVVALADEAAVVPRRAAPVAQAILPAVGGGVRVAVPALVLGRRT